jgi:16S rRNA C967 or C1407 C5-methylase (RsmB/RsmF family)/NOL1/NOP2/fmu family ribosome biogenesis protein
MKLASNKDFSLPKDFVNLLIEQWGAGIATDLLKNIKEGISPISIRYNPAKQPVDDGLPVGWESNAIYLAKRPHFVLDPRWHAGAYYVQEASSMIVKAMICQRLDLTTSLKVLDLCAAPGGKSTQMLSLVNRDSIVVSNELIGKRASVLKENIMKWGAANAIVTNNEIPHFRHFQQAFDVVLMDAPCSGEGMFRKDPASITEWSLANVAICSVRQKKIIDEAVALVKDHGYLIYSTCTYNREENIENIKYITATYDFDCVEMNLEEAWGFVRIEDGKNVGWQAFPGKVNGEGFFIGILQKKSHRSIALTPNSYRSKSLDEQKPSPHELSMMSGFLNEPTQFQFVKKNEDWYAIRRDIFAFTKMLLEQMNVIYVGIRMGQFKKENFIPDAALALSNELPIAIPKIELSEAQALQYLKKETLQLANEEGFEGWAVVRFQQINLGWIKILPGGRINNYFPLEWRIKMNLDRLEA